MSRKRPFIAASAALTLLMLAQSSPSVAAEESSNTGSPVSPSSNLGNSEDPVPEDLGPVPDLGLAVAKAERGPDGVLPIARAAKPVPGSYILQVRRGVDPRSVARAAKASPNFVYESALNGFSAELNAGQLNAAQRNPNVTFIQENSETHLNATQTLNDSGLWGLDRIDQRDDGRSNTYNYNSTGAGVTAYILDNGFDTTHPEFDGRAQPAYDVTGGGGLPCNNKDGYDGHGTHVAGIVGGKTYGVAKSVRIRTVKAMSCTSPKLEQIIEAVDWVRVDAKAKGKPAIANISLGADRVGHPTEDLLITAVTNLWNSGVFVAVAAGNKSKDACSEVPAAAPAVVTVAASNRYDSRAEYSNWGSCVDLYAPGSDIKSAHLNHGWKVDGGTSMASPHVAGVAALYKSAYGQASSGAVWNGIKAHATTSAVINNPSGTPNRLLYQKTNPYSAKQACGSSYTTRVHTRDLSGKARMYLLYSPTTGKNCAVTIKTTKIGALSSTEAWLIKQGDSEWQKQVGQFKYYAGPVYRYAPSSCVQYAGGHDGSNWTSGWLGCN